MSSKRSPVRQIDNWQQGQQRSGLSDVGALLIRNGRETTLRALVSIIVATGSETISRVPRHDADRSFPDWSIMGVEPRHNGEGFSR
ncbi:MAG: hypothetical protein OXI81_04910 [Paracoccaceae bacterium]|nr:hypothetical protein [Paracoccaceae bacterium]